MNPPMVMADTLTAVRLMPTDWAASSSSPTARSTEPTRLLSSHQSAAMAAMTQAQMKSATSAVDQPFSGKYRICLKPSPPSGPTWILPLAIW